MIFKIIHLYFCFRHLGLNQGWRYWKLTLQAMGDSTRWAELLRKEANKEDVMKRHETADAFRVFANELERFNTAYHK